MIREGKPLQTGKHIHAHLQQSLRSGPGQQIGVRIRRQPANHHHQRNKRRSQPHDDLRHLSGLHPGTNPIQHPGRQLLRPEHNREHILGHEGQTKASGSGSHHASHTSTGNQVPARQHVLLDYRLENRPQFFILWCIHEASSSLPDTPSAGNHFQRTARHLIIFLPPCRIITRHPLDIPPQIVQYRATFYPLQGNIYASRHEKSPFSIHRPDRFCSHAHLLLR